MPTDTSQHELGSERIPRLLFRYALPSIIAMTATSLYNLVDSIFIGQGCGALAIAGLAITFPFMNLSAAFGAMVGVGGGTLISVKMGQNNIASAERTLGNVVILNVVISLAFMALALAYMDSILMFFGASEATLPYARVYMRILMYGNVLSHSYLGLNDAIRSSGYPKRAMAATLTAVVLNIVFDYLFIMVCDMGIAGAAVGTLVAQAVAFALQMIHFSSRRTYLRFHIGIFRPDRKIAGGILSIGLAPFLIHCCACLVVMLINNGLQTYGGDLYVGAYGIDNRVMFIFLMVVQGFNQGTQPIVGYNYGAGKLTRSVGAYKLNVLCATVVTCICFAACETMPGWIVSWFTNDAALTEIATHALRIMAAMMPLVGFQMASVSFFTSLGKAHKSIFLSLTRQLIFLVPFLIFLPHYMGTDGIWYSLPLADLVSVITTAIMIYLQLRTFRRSSQPL